MGKIIFCHDLQKLYKNTAPIFTESGILCKFDNPFSLLRFRTPLLSKDII